MHISDDALLDANFDQLRQRLLDPDSLSPLRGAPVFYYVYEPKHILAVRRLLPGWIGRLRNEQNLKVLVISLADVLWKLIDASGRWQDWLEAEKDFDQHEINQSIASVLQEENVFIHRVAALITASAPDTVVFLTDLELLHPFARSRPIESILQNPSQNNPTVFFYPGRRAGQYGLKFLGFYPEDTGYRSTLIGE